MYVILVYDINLTQEEVNRILDEYAKAGVLSPRFRHFVFVSRQYKKERFCYLQPLKKFITQFLADISQATYLLDKGMP